MAATYTDPQLHGLVRTMLKELPTSFPDAEDEARLAELQSADAATLAKTIDHTLLAPTASPTDIVTLCTVAHRAGTASVCVNSNMLAFAVAALTQLRKDAPAPSDGGGGVVPIAVVGFPFGSANTAGKVAETVQALADGAREIDMVQALSYLRAGLFSYVLNDIRAVVAASRHAAGGLEKEAAPVKVILETANLTRDQIATSALLACLAGADYIKTSTGYALAPLEGRPLGARVEDVRLMRWVAAYHERVFLAVAEQGPAGKRVKVKASGGIGSAEALRRMLAAGADRIGASRTEAIVKELTVPAGAGAAATDSAAAAASSDAY
ncbi:hypothetical protein OC835_002072 [Tilletia horrida]|nr:hypothetical protein OC835_002072 [Tilletia horrida]